MLLSTIEAERVLHAAIDALAGRDDRLGEVLDALPVPVYVTDRAGVITYYNSACIEFAGRVPVVGADSWCVTWKIYTEAGAFVPHDHCPMAVALREQRAVRGVTAVAERPDGTRRSFRPYPTPLYDDSGALTGAINLLVDVTVERQADELESQALRCRRLADGITDQRTIETLQLMAAQYETEALKLKRSH